MNKPLETMANFNNFLEIYDGRKAGTSMEQVTVWDIICFLFNINRTKINPTTQIPFVWWYISIAKLMRLPTNF